MQQDDWKGLDTETRKKLEEFFIPQDMTIKQARNKFGDDAKFTFLDRKLGKRKDDLSK